MLCTSFSCAVLHFLRCMLIFPLNVGCCCLSLLGICIWMIMIIQLGIFWRGLWLLGPSDEWFGLTICWSYMSFCSRSKDTVSILWLRSLYFVMNLVPFCNLSNLLMDNLMHTVIIKRLQWLPKLNGRQQCCDLLYCLALGDLTVESLPIPNRNKYNQCWFDIFELKYEKWKSNK